MSLWARGVAIPAGAGGRVVVQPGELRLACLGRVESAAQLWDAPVLHAVTVLSPAAPLPRAASVEIQAGKTLSDLPIPAQGAAPIRVEIGAWINNQQPIVFIGIPADSFIFIEVQS